MTRCDICEAVLPEVIDPAFAEQGHRTIVWFGSGPYVICKHHSFDEMMLWIAETLVCDAEMARRYRERLAADRTAIYDMDGLLVEVTLPGGDGAGLERSVRTALDQGVAE